jgi:hypothetical protein
MIGLESGCPQGINSDPAWSEKVYTPISNKQPLGKTLYCTSSTLQHLLFGNFAIAIVPLFCNVVLRVRRAASTDLWQACEYCFTE